MRLIRRLLALAPAALLATASACANDLLPVEQPDEFVFEVEYTNYAWGATWHGIAIDANGNVWAWDRGGEGHVGEPAKPSGTDLAEKYGPARHLLRHLNPTEVAAHAALIEAAEHGPILAPVGRCADAGILRFRAFEHDEAADAYTPVVLHQEGDVAQKNTAQAAAELTAWLRSMDARFAAGTCQP
jgi:hypothetical protein